MCLNAWSLDGCTLLGDHGAFGMWGLGGVSSLGVVFGVYVCLLFQYCFLFWSAKKQDAYPFEDLPPHLPCYDGLKSLKLSQIKPSSLRLFNLRYFVIVVRKYRKPNKVIVESKAVQGQSCGTLQGQGDEDKESFGL